MYEIRIQTEDKKMSTVKYFYKYSAVDSYNFPTSTQPLH